MEASVSNMHQSKFALSIQNFEKQRFCKKVKITHQKINASHLAFLQAWNEEIDFLIYLKQRILICRWNLKQTTIFKKK